MLYVLAYAGSGMPLWVVVAKQPLVGSMGAHCIYVTLGEWPLRSSNLSSFLSGFGGCPTYYEATKIINKTFVSLI